MNVHVTPIELNFDDITDFFVPNANDPRTARAYYGKTPPVEVKDDPALLDWVSALIDQAQSEAYDKEMRPYRIEVAGVAYRVQRGQGVQKNQTVLQMRHLKRDVPALSDLRMPPHFSPILQRKFTNGLFLFVGDYGRGKTTLASSAFVTRLRRFSGLGRCIEDPIEMAADGPQGAGYCSQERVENNIADTLESLSRGFPAVDSNHLFIGELLDPRTAAQTLLAATNGLVVFTTTHGLSIPSALERICSMATTQLDATQAQYLLSTCLRVAVHQSLAWDDSKTGWQRGVIDGQILFMPPDSPNAKYIKAGDFSNLDKVIEHQNARFAQAAAQGTAISDELDAMERNVRTAA